MKKFIKLLFILAILAVISVSCEKNEIYLTGQNTTDTPSVPFNEGVLKLGKQLENPYSVSNMRKAYQNLKDNNQLKSTISITVTDYYVRFFPKTVMS